MTTPTTKKLIQKLALKKSESQNNMLFEVVNNNQAHIIFNRPKIMNAFSFDMYFSFVEFINKANQMPPIKYIVIKGAGGNFSSGNDLNNFMIQEIQEFDKRAGATAMADILQQLTISIVKSRKPIFAIVEGKAVGFAFTQLALYDKVFATKSSMYVAPLVKIAQGPQMASSYLFPKIFGQSLAQDLIIKARPMKAKQLQAFNFVSCHEDAKQAHQALQQHINELESLDWASYVEARRLMRLNDVASILKANELECQNLVQRWTNPELLGMMVKYLSNRKQRPKL